MLNDGRRPDGAVNLKLDPKKNAVRLGERLRATGFRLDGETPLPFRVNVPTLTAQLS
jgi:hypothetical protein